MLKGKTVLLGVLGSTAAYKTAYLASSLKKLNADVHVLMTENATNFINPITFETLTGNKCLQCGACIPGEEGGCGDACAGERQCHRKDRPRNRGRYADHDDHGVQMQEDHRAGHEHEHV